MSDDRVFAKCAWRLIPLMALVLLVNYIDRLNVGFAALSMNKDLGFSPAAYGLGAGMFFLSYAPLQVPARRFMRSLTGKVLVPMVGSAKSAKLARKIPSW